VKIHDKLRRRDYQGSSSIYSRPVPVCWVSIIPVLAPDRCVSFVFIYSNVIIFRICAAFRIKKNQRLFSAFGNSPMGYAFPAAIGASIANKKKRIIFAPPKTWGKGKHNLFKTYTKK
jgi:hypothetical protein